MEHKTRSTADVDAYIDAFPLIIKEILRHIRTEIRRCAPRAAETIKYNMPAYVLNGRDILYFGAFKSHIGLFPPVREAELLAAIRPYRGEKGNLKFPLAQPIPYTLIGQIAEARVRRVEGSCGDENIRLRTQYTTIEKQERVP